MSVVEMIGDDDREERDRDGVEGCIYTLLRLYIKGPD